MALNRVWIRFADRPSRSRENNDDLSASAAIWRICPNGIYFPNSMLTPREFMRFLMHDLLREGDSACDGDLVTVHRQFNELLLSEASAGRRVIVVIDEAQCLDESVLETICRFSNFETAHSKLLQIVLAGQNRLAVMLKSPGLVQLRQRISTIVQLHAFEPEEASNYIDYRLKIAGYTGSDLFTPTARKLLIESSGGTPRNINTLCFNALSLACALRSKIIDNAIINEVITDLRLENESAEPPVLSDKEAPLSNSMRTAVPVFSMQKTQQTGTVRAVAPPIAVSVENTAPMTVSPQILPQKAITETTVEPLTMPSTSFTSEAPQKMAHSSSQVFPIAKGQRSLSAPAASWSQKSPELASQSSGAHIKQPAPQREFDQISRSKKSKIFLALTRYL